MTYKDLPDNWPDLPIAGDAYTSDILDLFVESRARLNGALIVLVCDERRRPVQPIAIDDVPSAMAPTDLAEPLERLAEVIAESFPGASALVALARPGSSRITLRDRAWQAAVARAFGGDVELIGVHVVTPRGSCLIETRAEAA